MLKMPKYPVRDLVISNLGVNPNLMSLNDVVLEEVLAVINVEKLLHLTCQHLFILNLKLLVNVVQSLKVFLITKHLGWTHAIRVVNVWALF